MIAYPRTETSATPPVMRLIGVGNAGVHLADQFVMAGGSGLEVIAMNTDAQSLMSSICAQKLAIGPKATRGLGTGGDPELGAEAARESADEIRAAVEGAGLVFLCTGLGGGTGSGLAPLVAEAAREAGATVFAVVTSPFDFEGRRRSAQAAEALAALGGQVHALLHFENDRMAELASPRSGIGETFAVSDATLLAAIASLAGILRGGGPMPVGLSDLLAAIGGGSPAGLFGRGESSGDNRAHEALELALKSPLLDRGRLLAESHAVLAHLSGPASLSFAEVATIMRELGRHLSDDVHLFLGVTASNSPSGPLTLTLFGNYAAGAAARPVPAPRQEARPRAVPVPVPVAEVPAEPKAAPAAEEKTFFEEPAPEAKPAPTARQAAPREPKPAAAPKPAPAPKVKQETLQFESVTRGRFEKSEPTIVEGEDLDVPTFLRMRGKT